MIKLIARLCLIVVALVSVMPVQSQERPLFEVEVNGLLTSLPIFSAFTLPEQMVIIKAVTQPELIEIHSATLRFLPVSAGSWRLRAPNTPGMHQIELVSRKSGQAMQINLFVLTPYTQMQQGQIEGYRIDEYPQNFRQLSSYDKPLGFVRVDEDNVDMLISPHFRLRQFLCKQKSGYPKFIAMQPTTLSMLEDFFAYVQEQGYAIDTFGVISAYRTPFYNRAIGNVKHSRHIYGDSMDLFIDQDGDGRLDDLNLDGRHDQADVKILYDLATAFHAKSKGMYVGGIGKYRPSSHHGGFVHMDNRGYKARW